MMILLCLLFGATACGNGDSNKMEPEPNSPGSEFFNGRDRPYVMDNMVRFAVDSAHLQNQRVSIYKTIGCIFLVDDSTKLIYPIYFIDIPFRYHFPSNANLLEHDKYLNKRLINKIKANGLNTNLIMMNGKHQFHALETFLDDRYKGEEDISQFKPVLDSILRVLDNCRPYDKELFYERAIKILTDPNAPARANAKVYPGMTGMNILEDINLGAFLAKLQDTYLYEYSNYCYIFIKIDFDNVWTYYPHEIGETHSKFLLKKYAYRVNSHVVSLPEN